MQLGTDWQLQQQVRRIDKPEFDQRLQLSQNVSFVPDRRASMEASCGPLLDMFKKGAGLAQHAFMC